MCRTLRVRLVATRILITIIRFTMGPIVYFALGWSFALSNDSDLADTTSLSSFANLISYDASGQNSTDVSLPFGVLASVALSPGALEQMRVVYDIVSGLQGLPATYPSLGGFPSDLDDESSGDSQPRLSTRSV